MLGSPSGWPQTWPRGETGVGAADSNSTSVLAINEVTWNNIKPSGCSLMIFVWDGWVEILIQSHSSFHFSLLMRSQLLSDKIEQLLRGLCWVKPLTALNRNPIHSTLSAVLNSSSQQDDRNNLPTEIDSSFQKSIFTIYFFQSSFERRFHIIPLQMLIISQSAPGMSFSKCEFLCDQCQHCAL